MIRVLICDGDGTLGLPNPSRSVRELLDKLDDLNIELVVASNNSRSNVTRSFRDAALTPPATIVTRFDFDLKGQRVKKPSPRFIDELEVKTGIPRHEMVFLGDDDETDIMCAINAGVLPLNATYSQADEPREYGLKAASPEVVNRFLRTFGQQTDTYFGWQYVGTCPDTRTRIDVRSLLYQHGWESDIARVLKQLPMADMNRRSRIRQVLLLDFISSCYQSRLTREVDWITVYPGHLADNKNDLLDAYSRLFARLFNDRFIPDLLVRHKDAPKSQNQGANRNIYDQFRTILVNPKYESRLPAKKVLVLDDFTTRGYSLETARRMLLEGGCESVTGVAFGKFRSDHIVSTIDLSWNPFIPCTLNQGDIRLISVGGTSYAQPDEYFRVTIWPEYM